jgi:hypothetical protein
VHGVDMLNSQTNRTTSELDRFEDKDLNFGRLLIAKPGVNYNINEIEAHYNFKKIKLLYRDYDEVLYCFRLMIKNIIFEFEQFNYVDIYQISDKDSLSKSFIIATVNDAYYAPIMDSEKVREIYRVYESCRDSRYVRIITSEIIKALTTYTELMVSNNISGESIAECINAVEKINTYNQKKYEDCLTKMRDILCFID